MKIDEYGTVVRAFDGWLDVSSLDPREYAWRDEHVIYARAIVGFACADLSIPAWV